MGICKSDHYSLLFQSSDYRYRYFVTKVANVAIDTLQKIVARYFSAIDVKQSSYYRYFSATFQSLFL